MSEVETLVAMFGDDDLSALWLVVALAEAFVRRNRRHPRPRLRTFSRR